MLYTRGGMIRLTSILDKGTIFFVNFDYFIKGLPVDGNRRPGVCWF